MATRTGFRAVSAARLETSKEQAVGAKTRARVLVVDDEPEVRNMVARVLRAAGYLTDKAKDGKSALELIQSEPFEAIVSDIVMPGMNGIELMRAIRQIDFDTPIILLTGTPSLQTATEAIELGAFRYLTKPVDTEELRRVVGRATAAHQMARLKRSALALDGGHHVASAGDRAGLEVSFERALAALWMAFQPIVRAADGSLYGYEALMRSSEPALPNPGAMLNAAERLGRLHELGRAIRARCTRVIESAPPEALFFVNLHPEDLLDDELLLEDAPLTRFAPRVVLEVTERATIASMNEVHERVQRLRALGFGIAVDDLGAGYAGLTSFATLAPNIVKLDMTLTRDLDTNPTKQRIVAAMIGLCRDTSTLVVAEGIETVGERDTIAALGCDLLQGYLIAKPGPPFPEVSW